MSARNIVLGLDGTWNSTYDEKHRDDGHKVLKPSNVLKLCRAVLPRTGDGREQLTYYDMGVGALAKYPGISNRLLHASDRIFGGAWGAGFEGNVEDALGFLANNHQTGDRVFVFGFSRGASVARALCHFLDWAGGLPSKRDVYYLPILFREYVVSKGERSFDDALEAIDAQRARERHPQPPLDPFQKIDVALLGVWDTVMALGSRFRATGSSTAVEERSFLVLRHPPSCARCACQALAIDEKRYDFRPEVWVEPAPGRALEQRWFAGVHSNVGGGYVDDGLANLAFRWLLGEAESLGLEVDQDFAGFYRGYAMDRLYRSESTLYRVLDRVRHVFGRGVRSLLDQPEKAGMRLDPSVIHRIAADPEARRKNGQPRFPDMKGKRYRPDNVLRFLARQVDLDAYLAGLGLDEEQRRLPADVTARIEELRAAG